MVTGREMQSAAQTILEGVQQQTARALTERELVGLVVEFANRGTLSGPLLRAPGVRLLVPIYLPPKEIESVSDDQIFPAPTKELAAARKRLQEDLAAALTGNPAPQTAARLKKAAGRMVAVPTYEVEHRRERLLRVRWHYVPTSLESILAYAILLLRDQTRGLGEDLKLCKLERCGQFFFSSESSEQTGRPRGIYCSNEHMLEAHRATSAERTRRYRERLAEKQK